MNTSDTIYMLKVCFKKNDMFKKAHLEFLSTQWAEPFISLKLLRVTCDELLHLGLWIFGSCGDKLNVYKFYTHKQKRNVIIICIKFQFFQNTYVIHFKQRVPLFPIKPLLSFTNFICSSKTLYFNICIKVRGEQISTYQASWLPLRWAFPWSWESWRVSGWNASGTLQYLSLWADSVGSDHEHE